MLFFEEKNFVKLESISHHADEGATKMNAFNYCYICLITILN